MGLASHRQPCRFVRWAYKLWMRRLNSRVREKYELFTLIIWSLCYNSFVDAYYMADTAMEPMFWFVDNFTRFFGPFFVFSVCSLLASVIVITYMIGVPYYWHRNPSLLIGLLVIGNWLLVNVVFHYYMAAITEPGLVPQGCVIQDAVSICKRCIAPKPARTHHCSVCNRCILKMDHHCPWLNSCIGHFNHRYFFLFCVYMTVGALFLIIFGFDVVYDHLGKYRNSPAHNNTVSVQSSVECLSGLCDTKMVPMTLDELISVSTYDPALPWQYESWYHGVLTYAALLCIGVCVALGSLAVWHGKMIARGETSVEAHINRAETVRLAKDGKLFVNPYNFGTHNNWKIFLGIHDGRTWCRHVLLPSAHPPQGSGIQWMTVHSRNVDYC